ncbi:MAG: class I SAM-dependent methyltransferase [Verrucomicrobium sp.]
MKDLVQNRRRMNLGQKLSLAGLAVRENGLTWTFLLGVYGAASAVANRAFGGMQSLREKRGIPGMNSRAMNRVIWESWNWDGGGDEWTPSEEWKASLMENILHPAVPSGAVVVEIGPGAGRWTGELLKKCSSYQGLDISATCVEVCTGKFGSDPKFKIGLTDGNSLPGVTDGTVDLVWSFDVFVHINSADVGAYLKEIARVLKPGGRAVLHHGSAGGAHGGWRSDLTTGRLNEMARSHGLEVKSQIDGWQDGATFHAAGLYEDLISTLEKSSHG